VLDVVHNLRAEDSVPFPGQDEPQDKAHWRKFVVLRQDPSQDFGPV